MKQRVQDLRQIGDALFSARFPLMSLWQTIAEQFYPERADFTRPHALGAEFASDLMTGRPALARRELANTLSAMLRPRSKQWFMLRDADERINEDATARAWLEWAAGVQRRIMYEPRARFIRATAAGDHDFAAFGQAVISLDLALSREHVIYRPWHLRDVAWSESAEMAIDQVHRDWKAKAAWLVATWGDKVAQPVRNCVDKEPGKEIDCRHIVVPADDYDLPRARNRERFPFVSISIDVANETVLEEVPSAGLGYVIPRWAIVAGSQYAHSPATVIALPDARLLQQITLTLLEAGQKAVDPPMVAVGEVISGGVNTYAGGVTWVDAEYDERLGEAVRPMSIDASGLSFGIEREQRVETLIKEAFFLNQIALPDTSGPDMTAYEVQKRVEEYIRRALPLFEPMEVEYNGALCEATFEMALRLGAFGPPEDMPQILRGRDISFQFESPLQAATGQAKTRAFAESAQLLATAAQIEPAARHQVDIVKAFRDAIAGTGAPAEWLVDERLAEEARKAEAEQMQAQQAAAAAGQIAGTVAGMEGGPQALAEALG